jgi:hypothetical protein
MRAGCMNQVRRLWVIARKDGEQVRLWARTTSDYFASFIRIRDAVAALPVESAVLDGLSATVSET